MRVFALSDIHVDHRQNAQWIEGVSREDYRDDILILAGDISDSLTLLRRTLKSLAACFRKVMFVPGNHELWVIRDSPTKTSFEKYAEVCRVAEETGIFTHPYSTDGVTFAPILGWYDFSFGAPSELLQSIWADFRACRWPAGTDAAGVAAWFDARNEPVVGSGCTKIISFSHFVPRADLIANGPMAMKSGLLPVLGAQRIDSRIRALGSQLHVYGHSHVRRRACINGVTYVNNALGYPAETPAATRSLLCIHDAESDSAAARINASSPRRNCI